MAFTTKCAHCNNTTWEVKTVDPVGGNYRQSILQCSICGVPIGVMDFYNLGSMLKKQEKEIGDLKKVLGQHGTALSWIQSALQAMGRR